MPNKPASAQYIDHLESLESLSHHSSVSEERGSAEWDFDLLYELARVVVTHGHRIQRAAMPPGQPSAIELRFNLALRMRSVEEIQRPRLVIHSKLPVRARL